MKVKFKGLEPYLVTRRVDKYGGVHVNEFYAFYPFRRLRMKIRIYLKKRRFKKSGYPRMRCNGCGEGVCEYRIIDPNGEGKWVNVCEHCVDFYDWMNSRQRLETDWDKDIDVRNEIR